MNQIIVLALPAPGAPALVPQRQRHTFWTACATCKERGKYPMEHLNSLIVCPHCNNSFTATEVSRLRKNKATDSVNAAPPPPKKVKKELTATEVSRPRNNKATTSAKAAPPPPPSQKKAKKDNRTEEESFIQKLTKQYDIQDLLKDMAKATVEEKVIEIKHAKNEGGQLINPDIHPKM